MKTRQRVTHLVVTLLGVSSFVMGQPIRDTLILRTRQTEPYRLVFYRVSDGSRLDTAFFDRWHLAFEIPGFTAAIRANLGAGLTVWRTGRPATAANWSALTLNDTLERLYDKDNSWSIGAFNTTANPQDSFDLGWGNYDFTTHAVVGDSLHILRLPDGSHRKLWLERLQSGVYYLKLANLDGTNEVSLQVPKSLAPRRNFVYLNLLTGQPLNLEPLDSLWDLVFTQYLTILPNGVPYPVVGALQNRRVSVARIPLSSSANPDTLSYNLYPYATAINTIGYNWKQFDMQTNSWLLADTVYYLVKTRSNEIWRLRFVGFGDSVTPAGDRIRYTVLERKKVADISALSGSKPGQLKVLTYPNPATEGVWIVLPEAVPVTLSLYDTYGRLLYEVQAEGKDLLYLSRRGLPAGKYWIRIQSIMGVGVTSLVFE